MRYVCFFAMLFAGELLAQDTTRLRLLFVGDIMQHDAQIASAFNPISQTYEYAHTFQWIKPLIQSADLAIGNLEFTLAGKPYKGYPQFSGPDELAFELKKAGFDVLVTANNHSVDRYKKGIYRTLDMLDSAKIIHTGTFKDSLARAATYPLLVEKNGFKIALLNYTYGTNGIPVPPPAQVNLIDTVLIKKDIQQAKAQHPDAILVLLHFGDEYQRSPNRFQKRLANLCFREGAQVVIGSHPHVIQPVEFFPERNQLVAWSLGNFLSNQRPRYRNGGLMLWVELEKIRADSASSFTRIHNANYDLAYVHVDKRKKFHLLPVNHPAGDSLLLRDSLARKTFQEFVTDSRQWLRNYNRLVPESADSLVYALVSPIQVDGGWVILPPASSGRSFFWMDEQLFECRGTYHTWQKATEAQLQLGPEVRSKFLIRLVPRSATAPKTRYRSKTPDR